MPIDPSASYRSRIEELEKERSTYQEGSPEWYRVNESIRFYNEEIRSVERMKRMGVKF